MQAEYHCKMWGVITFVGTGSDGVDDMQSTQRHARAGTDIGPGMHSLV